MDKENIYIRKDVYEAEKKALLTEILNQDKRIDDLKYSVSIAFTILTAFFSLSQILLVVILYLLNR